MFKELALKFARGELSEAEFERQFFKCVARRANELAAAEYVTMTPEEVREAREKMPAAVLKTVEAGEKAWEDRLERLSHEHMAAKARGV